jgi:hypothetical protein
MKKRAKQKKGTDKAEIARAIFADTEIPKDANEITEKYVWGYKDHETVDTYRERAVAVLRANGYDVDVDTDTEWFTRITDNADLNAEVYEALRLVLVYAKLQSQKRFFLKIVGETKQASAPVEGYDSIPEMIDGVQSMAGEIGALGERLKAHMSDADALRGKLTLKYARKGNESVHGTPKEKRTRWNGYQVHVDRVAQPGMSHWYVSGLVASELNVSQKTIYRNTTLKNQPAK